MLRPLPLMLCAALAVGGCARLAESRINPLNWFGRSVEVLAPASAEATRPLVPPGRATVIVDARQPVLSVRGMAVDRMPDGAIVRATGVTATQGWFNAQLVRRGLENGVLTLEFVAEAPPAPAGTGAEATRQITAATRLSEADLAGVRVIRVRGAQNAREARR